MNDRVGRIYVEKAAVMHYWCTHCGDAEIICEGPALPFPRRCLQAHALPGPSFPPSPVATCMSTSNGFVGFFLVSSLLFVKGFFDFILFYSVNYSFFFLKLGILHA